MLTMCHAQADVDSSDHVARSVILHPVSLAVGVHLPVKSVGATAAYWACHARTFLLLTFLGPKVGSTKEQQHKHVGKAKAKGKDGDEWKRGGLCHDGRLAAGTAQFVLWYLNRRGFGRRVVRRNVLGANVEDTRLYTENVSQGDGRHRV